MNLFENSKSECDKAAAEKLAEKITEIANTGKNVILGIGWNQDIEEVLKNLLNLQVPWSKVHIFMIDERCVTLNSLESNYRHVYNIFIKQLIETGKLPKDNAHPFMYDPENAPSSIKKYDQALSNFERKFDILLVSSGEDGHIGSLFPKHNSIITENTTFFLMNNSPKPPVKRMAAPRRLLQTAKVGIILFSGEKKQHAFDNFSNPNISIQECPAKTMSALNECFVFKSTSK